MIEIRSDVDAAIRAHGEATYPEECCGALLGAVDGDARRVTEARRIDNARSDERRRRFLITPEDYRDAERAAEAAGRVLVGFYHSHPDHPARPSQYDLDHALPWHSYIVLGVQAGRAADCTSWVLSADRTRFEPEPLRVS